MENVYISIKIRRKQAITPPVNRLPHLCTFPLPVKSNGNYPNLTIEKKQSPRYNDKCQYIIKQRGVFILYNDIIMQLSNKNKYYRTLNEPLIHRIRELAAEQAKKEAERGIKKNDGFIPESIKTELRGDKIMSCGTFLELNIDSNGAKVTSGNFCHDKFCALCSKIRAVKRYSQMINVINELRKQGIIYGKHEVIIGMITLTQKNVPIEDLKDELNQLSKGIKRLTQSKLWKDCIKGYAKSLEITYNMEARTYHPHYHFLVIWNKEQYKIHSSTIQSLWQRSLRLNYVPECKIQEAYGKNADLSNIISECLKYNIKGAKENQKPLYSDLTIQEFQLLLEALKHKRLISYNGIIAETRRKLRYPDEDSDKNTDIEIKTNIALPEEAHRIILQWSESQQSYVEYDYKE